MKSFFAALLPFALVAGVRADDDTTVFIPPKAYPVARYEAGWGKNPFTLKTAPVPVDNPSFAKDLAVATYYGDAENPTIVVVNTKTHERFSLRKDRPAKNGMTLGSVKLADSRKDVSVEVTMGTETSELKFDNSYVQQVASTQSARAGAPQVGQPGRPQPGMPAGIQQRTAPGQPGQPAQPRLPVPQPIGNPATTRPAAPAGVPGTVGRAPAPLAVPNLAQTGVPGVDVTATVDGSNVNLSVSSGAPVPTNNPLVTQVTPSDAPPVPQRRRIITPVANTAPQ